MNEVLGMSAYDKKDHTTVYVMFKFKGYAKVGKKRRKVNNAFHGFVKAMAKLDFDTQLNLIKSEVVFIDLAEIKETEEVEIFAGDILDYDDEGKLMGTRGVCLTGDWKLKLRAHFPDVATPADTKEKLVDDRPRVYYKNEIDVKAIIPKVQGIDIKKLTIDPDELTKEKIKRIDDPELPYNFVEYIYKAEKNYIEPTRYSEATKSDYWINIDQAHNGYTGEVYAYNEKYEDGKKRSNEYIKEFVTYDASGKEINRTDIDLKIPHSAIRYYPYSQGVEDYFRRYRGAVLIFFQQYGFGYKKFNPEPDKKLFSLYQWGSQGELLGKSDFHTVGESNYFTGLFSNKNNFSLLIYGREEKQYYMVYGENGKISEPQPLSMNDAAFTGLSESDKQSLPRLIWEYRYEFAKNEDVFAVYRLTSTEQQKPGAPVITHNEGHMLTFIDAKGKVNKMFRIPAKNESSKLKCYERGDIVFLEITSSLTEGQSATQVFQLDKNTKEVKQCFYFQHSSEFQFKQSATSFYYFGYDTQEKKWVLYILPFSKA